MTERKLPQKVPASRTARALQAKSGGFNLGDVDVVDDNATDSPQGTASAGEERNEREETEEKKSEEETKEETKEGEEAMTAKKTDKKSSTKKPTAKAAPAKAAVKKPTAKAAPAKKPTAKAATEKAATEKKPTEKKPRSSTQETRNGVPHPRPGGITASIWSILDAYREKVGDKAIVRKEAIKLITGKKCPTTGDFYEPGTAGMQFYRWSIFHSLRATK